MMGAVRKHSLRQMGRLMAVMTPLLSSVSAFAMTIGEEISTSHLFLGIVTLGSLGVAAIASFAFLRDRQKYKNTLQQKTHDLSETISRLKQVENLLSAEKQLRLIWENGGGEPQLYGDIRSLFPNFQRRDIFRFENWVSEIYLPAFRQSLREFINQGREFVMELKTPEGRDLEAEAVIAGGVAMVTLKPLAVLQQKMNQTSQMLAENREALNEMEHFLDTLPHPLWLRDKVGKLRFVNRAFAAAVEQPQTADAVLSNMEFLDSAVQQEISRARVANQAFYGAVNATAAGARRTFNVVDRPFEWGSGGLAVDITETDKLKRERAGEMAALQRTFDMLGTAVVMYDVEKRPVFYNNAFLTLFSLETSYMETRPSEGDVLDRLRDNRKLPEQSNYRTWKDAVLNDYQSRSFEAIEDNWFLPDRSTLRVIRVPHPQGGITAVYEDQTEKIEIEKRFASHNRIQNETLENLNEAVAVFGADGKLSFWNGPFVTMWDLSEDLLKNNPHIDKIIDCCSHSLSKRDALAKLRNIVVSFYEARSPFNMRIEKQDDTFFDLLAVPLPDAGTLVTFRDVTREVEAERFMQERNEALIAADKLKTAFVEHVSYELRTPLTSVIGFTEVLLAFSDTMTPQQRSYLNDISTASHELDRTINLILDYAGLEAGSVQLVKQPINLKQLLQNALNSVQGKRPKDGIKLTVEIQSGLVDLVGDPDKLVQILHNILSNAMSFAPVEGRVNLKVVKSAGDILFSVSDNGPGMDEAVKQAALTPFISNANGTSHRGMGLGLPISQMLAKLHGGLIHINSVKGEGTTVTLQVKAS